MTPSPCPAPPAAFVPELSVMISLAWPLPVMQHQLRDLGSVLTQRAQLQWSLEHCDDCLLLRGCGQCQCVWLLQQDPRPVAGLSVQTRVQGAPRLHQSLPRDQPDLQTRARQEQLL